MKISLLFRLGLLLVACPAFSQEISCNQVFNVDTVADREAWHLLRLVRPHFKVHQMVDPKKRRILILEPRRTSKEGRIHASKLATYFAHRTYAGLGEKSPLAIDENFNLDEPLKRDLLSYLALFRMTSLSVSDSIAFVSLLSHIGASIYLMNDVQLELLKENYSNLCDFSSLTDTMEHLRVSWLVGNEALNKVGLIAALYSVWNRVDLAWGEHLQKQKRKLPPFSLFENLYGRRAGVMASEIAAHLPARGRLFLLAAPHLGLRLQRELEKKEFSSLPSAFGNEQ